MLVMCTSNHALQMTVQNPYGFKLDNVDKNEKTNVDCRGCGRMYLQFRPFFWHCQFCSFDVCADCYVSALPKAERANNKLHVTNQAGLVGIKNSYHDMQFYMALHEKQFYPPFYNFCLPEYFTDRLTMSRVLC